MLTFLRTFIFKIINSVVKIFLEIFVFDKQIRRILKGKWAKLYLKKYVKKAIKHKVEQVESNNQETIIWQYWEQGIENAPDIVKACVKSVEKYKNNNKHIILNKEDIKKYVEIPEYLWKLNEKGIIKSAHMSDIIRTFLLEKYGGVWVDSTILFTDELPKYITNSEIFVFQNDLRTDLDGLIMANYFIASKPHNKIIAKMRYILEQYWHENHFVCNYFFYLHSFSMLVQMDKELKEEFSKIPFASFIPVQRFQKEIMNEYSNERFEQIKKMSTIHKLSYKQNVLNKKNLDIKNTFLEKLIRS